VTAADQIRLTMPEISALSLRAARGAGLDWGMAEECASAATWLAAHQFNWANAVLHQLETPMSRQVIPAIGRWHADEPVCGLHVGATLSDFACLPEGPGFGVLSLGPINGPLMLVPFVVRAAKQLDTAFDVSLGAPPWLRVSGDCVQVLAGRAGPEMIAEVTISPTRHAPDPPHNAADQNAVVSRDQYDRLDRLALKMTVPSSALSAKGAGGLGLDDD
jgi:hypothetical protein